MIHSSNSLTLTHSIRRVLLSGCDILQQLDLWSGGCCWQWHGLPRQRLEILARPWFGDLQYAVAALQLDMDNIINRYKYMKHDRPSMFGRYIWDYMLIHLENWSCFLASAACKLYQRFVWWFHTFGIFISFSRKTLHFMKLFQLKWNTKHLLEQICKKRPHV